jgi:hypothetical protein
MGIRDRHDRLRRARLLAALAAALLAACTSMVPYGGSGLVSNRPDGEGYAGAGELVLRLGPPPEKAGWFGALGPHARDASSVELRYIGLDANGRAVFRRHDVDAIAGAPLPSGAAATDPADTLGGRPPALPPDTRDIVIDMRLARQIRLQGKIVEIVEATRSGVVFRLY